MNRESRRLGLKWKIGGIFTAVMLILGAFVVAAVYRLTENTLRDQLDKRAIAVATNFSDAAAGHINILALLALARKYTLLEASLTLTLRMVRVKSSPIR
jgi:sensor histidine kinase regulating citrate/malate metabolism